MEKDLNQNFIFFGNFGIFGYICEEKNKKNKNIEKGVGEGFFQQPIYICL